jgi:hypothetical protein
MKERSTSAVVISLSVLVLLVMLEPWFRIALSVPIFHWEDFRQRKIITNALGASAEYHPVLGWRLRPNMRIETVVDGQPRRLTTAEHGIRRNGASDNRVRTGGVLVSGSSLALGAEVGDEQAYPAQLEQLIGRPVVNGSNSRFGFDQIALRAEELLPIVRPSLLVIDISPETIARAAYSVSARPKPYFTVSSRRLVQHNVPVPKESGGESGVSSVLGYSLFLDRVMGAVASRLWYGGGSPTNIRVDNDAVAVTCLLLERLRAKARDVRARIVLNIQYQDGEIGGAAKKPFVIDLVADCARQLSIGVVDEFDAMKKLSSENRADYDRHFLAAQADAPKQKSAYGHRKVAERLAAELSNLPTEGPEGVRLRIPGPTGQHSLIPASALTERTTEILKVEAVSNAPDTGPVFRLSAVGGATEHYLGMGTPPQPPGLYTFWLEARPETTSRLVLQLVHNGTNGAFSTFDLQAETAAAAQFGAARDTRTGMTRTPDGWYRVWLSTATADPSTITLYIKIHDPKGAGAFAPAGESLLIRQVALEREGLTLGQSGL